MIRRHIPIIIKAVFYALALALMLSCEESPKSERWIGVYSYPNNSTKFSLYLDLTVKGRDVSGRAFDGNMEEATVSGRVDGTQYSLLLHPQKQGSSTGQDIHYRGKRSEDSIVGEWEHVVGVKGSWNAATTELPAGPALKLHALPCERASIDRKTTVASCGKDA
jgi:hypothetical protein